MICKYYEADLFNIHISLRKIMISDALKPESTTDTSQVTVVGAVLGVLLFLSMIAIVFLMVWVLRLGKYSNCHFSAV